MGKLLTTDTSSLTGKIIFVLLINGYPKPLQKKYCGGNINSIKYFDIFRTVLLKVSMKCSL